MNPIYSLTSTARLRFKALAAVIVCVMSASLAASAQGDVQMTQYWAVPTSFNPAATATPTTCAYAAAHACSGWAYTMRRRASSCLPTRR